MNYTPQHFEQEFDIRITFTANAGELFIKCIKHKKPILNQIYNICKLFGFTGQFFWIKRGYNFFLTFLYSPTVTWRRRAKCYESSVTKTECKSALPETSFFLNLQVNLGCLNIIMKIMVWTC